MAQLLAHQPIVIYCYWLVLTTTHPYFAHIGLLSTQTQLSVPQTTLPESCHCVYHGWIVIIRLHLYVLTAGEKSEEICVSLLGTTAFSIGLTLSGKSLLGKLSIYIFFRLVQVNRSF